jgi:hypothetical protein
MADPSDKNPTHVDCPTSHPYFIFSASAGFGGDFLDPVQNVSEAIERRAITNEVSTWVSDWRASEGPASMTYMPWLGRVLHGIKIG